jgi:hypothetical protein
MLTRTKILVASGVLLTSLGGATVASSFSHQTSNAGQIDAPRLEKAPHPDYVSVDRSSRLSPITDYIQGGLSDKERHYISEKATQECMAARGFDYTVRSADSIFPPSPTTLGELEQYRMTFGYGISIADTVATEATFKAATMSPKQQVAYDNALGVDDRDADGCRAIGLSEVPPKPHEIPAELDLVRRVVQAYDTDTRIADGVAKWAECMKTAGVIMGSTPFLESGQSLLRSQYDALPGGDDFALQKFASEERRIAAIDFDCYVRTVALVRPLVEQSILEKFDVAPMK